MSYARWGDRWYKVTVKSTVDNVILSVVGQYSNVPNAVFGALRRLNIDLPGGPRREYVTIQCELLPMKPRGMSKAEYTRRLRAEHESL